MRSIKFVSAGASRHTACPEDIGEDRRFFSFFFFICITIIELVAEEVMEE